MKQRNFVAKYAMKFNKAVVMTSKKQKQKAGYTKHKTKLY
jgi:hypothetical protein